MAAMTAQVKGSSIAMSPFMTMGVRSTFHSLVALLLLTFLVVVAVYLTQNSSKLVEDQDTADVRNLVSLSRCNLFQGKWVYDNESYPLYKEQDCSFMSDQLACQKFGRKDLEYQNWRWQPDQCDIPRFNATVLLERLRNKRLVYVGDSLNRGQWVSMVCLVDSAIPTGLKSMQQKLNGSLMVFTATEYNTTIEFYWAPLLVESNSDDPINHRIPDRIVRVQGIEKHAKYWTDADILVFNSYLWWRRAEMKALWGSFANPDDSIVKEVKMPRVYEMALQTWADWLEVHVNRTKTQLFFVSMSPTHQAAEEWGVASGQNCYGENEPILKQGYRGKATCGEMMHVVDTVLDGLKNRGMNIEMINITQLTDYRKEGHPSIYRKQWEPLKEEERLNPSSYADCIHWCLPGVPDVWNEILYTYIMDL
ncbi:Protein trichome birefringence-like 34 [Linum perenne]